jgi:hypothetical protein
MDSGSVLTRGAGIAFSSPQQLFANTIQQDQAIKDSKQLKKEILDKADDLKKIVSQSHEILMSANTVFPMSLFPDTVTVDRTKVTITRRRYEFSHWGRVERGGKYGPVVRFFDNRKPRDEFGRPFQDH